MIHGHEQGTPKSSETGESSDSFMPAFLPKKGKNHLWAERMLDIHDWITKVIAERNTDKAIRQLEHHHFDIQIDQFHSQNDENYHDHHGKPNRISGDKGGDERNLH